VADLRAALAPVRARGEVGLVPTMGAFHAGHRSLMRAARERCATVVVSLFVNPLQFAPAEDLAGYPRDEALDAEQARVEGVDVLFVPSPAEVYPDGFSTTVTVAGLTDVLEGAGRGAAHFAGVTTVVAKLLNMARPDVAFFGQKDAQQALVVRRMAADLDFGVEIAVCPTVREPDGLALSSRNAYLSAQERSRAVALRRALEAAEGELARGVRDAARLRAAGLAAMRPYAIEPEYLELVCAGTLAPVRELDGRSVLMAVAARVGRARLIDNVLLSAVPNQEP